jgi:phage-related minor tail protein
MGESGPEAIMPLREMSDGALGVAASTAPVAITLVVDGAEWANVLVDNINRNQTIPLRVR